ISGFCIHLRWAKARAAGRPPQTGFVAFWKRRIFRLYPPYLIALACYMFVLMLEGKIVITGFFAFDLGVHLVMLHNVSFETAYSFNGAFWTLAIEEQLYLAYFLLLFLRRRLGWKWTLAICFGVRLLWFAFSTGLNPLLASLFGQPFSNQSHSFGVQIPINEGALFHWFTWVLGAFAVEGAVGLVKVPAWCRNLWLGLVALTTAAALAYFDRTGSIAGVSHVVVWLVIDPLWGLGFFCIVNAAVAREQKWRMARRIPRAIALLAAVGIFSYSLYLMHELILTHFLRMTSGWFGVTDNGLTLFSLLVLSPVCVAFAWAFFQLFERPFIPKPADAAAELAAAGAGINWRGKTPLILRRAVIAALVAFALAEVGLRVYDRVHPSAVFQDASYNRFRGRPFAPDYSFRLNSRGFKDMEFPQQKADGSRRILGIGGSGTFAAPPYQYAYLTLLEQRLSQSSGTVEVVNMGIPNLRPRDYFALLLREGLALQPDLVVVSVSIGSDVSGGTEEAQLNSYVASYLRSLTHGDERYVGMIYNGTPAYQDDQPTLADADYVNLLRARSGMYGRQDEAIEAQVADTVSYLVRIKRLCDDHKIGLTVVVIPEEVQVNRALQSQLAGTTGGGPGGYDFARPSRLLAGQLSARDIDCLDLFDEFAGAANQTRLYKPNDGRWNIAGNRLAAEILERHLAARLSGATAARE
ncbi:MAG TPA: acyltransferase family protein, partial [Blastocatellia bacterium]|nr:acyltransferase family protein [Blastocatellia bacterium]